MEKNNVINQIKFADVSKFLQEFGNIKHNSPTQDIFAKDKPH